MVGITWRSSSAASCPFRLLNNPSGLITSAPARSWRKAAKAVSKSRSVLACKTCSCSPIVSAAAAHLSVWAPPGIWWVEEPTKDLRRGNQFVQQLQVLRHHLIAQVGHACEIAARSVQARDKSGIDWVDPG